jgi:hypothetical protein
VADSSPLRERVRRQGAFLALWLRENFQGMANHADIVQGWAQGLDDHVSQFYWWEEGKSGPSWPTVDDPNSTLYQGIIKHGKDFARTLLILLDPGGTCHVGDDDLSGLVDQALKRVEGAARNHLQNNPNLFTDITRQFFRWFGTSVAWAILKVLNNEVERCRGVIDLHGQQDEQEEDPLDNIPAPEQLPDIVTLIEEENNRGLLNLAREFLSSGRDGVLGEHAAALMQCVRNWIIAKRAPGASPEDQEKLMWLWILGYLREMIDLRGGLMNEFWEFVGPCLRRSCCQKDQSVYNHTRRLRFEWAGFLTVRVGKIPDR